MIAVELELREDEIEWFRIKAAYLGVPMIIYILFLLRNTVWTVKEKDDEARRW